MMKRILFSLLFTGIYFALAATEITRIEPAFWWTGMNNSELQILIHGKNISNAQLNFDYPGVSLKEEVRVENPDYLFLYLDIAPGTKAGTINLTFKEGKKTKVYPYELKPRASSVGAQGFISSDVLYLIMPDRFANGDTGNDVWDNVAIDRNDPFGRHGGDFAGINKQLDYIADLGVTAIWLNPVLENKMPQGSYHGYAITDFYQVDPRFGSNDDYCSFIGKAHSKGLKVVMDMIFNHCGSKHWWMGNFPTSDWLNHQDGFAPTSHNLYVIMDPHAPKSEYNEFVDGWFVPSMPDLNQRNRLLADYLIQNSIWWIEYARIDGIRHDTHPYADYEFLARWCKRIEEEYPGFNIVGESWYTFSSPLAWWQQNSILNENNSYLKTTMDFAFMNACEKAFNTQADERNPLRNIYEVIAQDFLYSDWNNLLIFLDNHDTSRFMKETDTNLDKYKQALALLLTMRGIPQLYYGTEILMHGEKSDGDGNLRKDFPGGWGEELNAFVPQGRNELQNEAWNYLQTLLQWRKNNKAVNDGKLIHYAPSWQTECYVYGRVTDESRILVLLNGSQEEKILDPAKYSEVIENYTSGIDVASGTNISLNENIVLPAKGVYILELSK